MPPSLSYQTPLATGLLTGARFEDEWQHVGDVDEQKIKCSPIRTREICSVRLYTIHTFRDSVVCKMHKCYCTMCKNSEYFHSLPSSDQEMQAIAIIRLIAIWKQTTSKCF